MLLISPLPHRDHKVPVQSEFATRIGWWLSFRSTWGSGWSEKMFLVHQAINVTSRDDVPGDMMEFEPKIKGINASSLFEVEDDLGKCYIGGAGGMPERLHTFYYADVKYEFCFYTRRHWEGDEYDVEVYDASVDRFTGPSPRIDPRDFDRISRNMTRFFTVRSFRVPRKLIFHHSGWDDFGSNQKSAGRRPAIYQLCYKRCWKLRCGSAAVCR